MIHLIRRIDRDKKTGQYQFVYIFMNAGWKILAVWKEEVQ